MSSSPLQELPKNLMGNPAILTAEIEGTQVPCLMDTGSQVTCIAESFYRTHLRHHPLEPIANLLVVGASGRSVPYLGYIEVKVCFTKETAGVDIQTTTLALVAPSRDGSNRAPLLLGTNTILWKDCWKAANKRLAQTTSRSYQ